MGKTPPRVTDAELAVLECLWQTGPATKRQIMSALYPGGSDSDRATVQKLLERLEGKGYVQRDRGAAAHVFSAAVSRTEFAGEQLQHLVDRFTGGALAPLVMHLVESKRLSAKERARLLKILDDSR